MNISYYNDNFTFPSSVLFISITFKKIQNILNLTKRRLHLKIAIVKFKKLSISIWFEIWFEIPSSLCGYFQFWYATIFYLKLGHFYLPDHSYTFFSVQTQIGIIEIWSLSLLWCFSQNNQFLYEDVNLILYLLCFFHLINI